MAIGAVEGAMRLARKDQNKYSEVRNALGRRLPVVCEYPRLHADRLLRDDEKASLAICPSYSAVRQMAYMRTKINSPEGTVGNGVH